MWITSRNTTILMCIACLSPDRRRLLRVYIITATTSCLPYDPTPAPCTFHNANSPRSTLPHASPGTTSTGDAANFARRSRMSDHRGRRHNVATRRLCAAACRTSPRHRYAGRAPLGRLFTAAGYSTWPNSSCRRDITRTLVNSSSRPRSIDCRRACLKSSANTSLHAIYHGIGDSGCDATCRLGLMLSNCTQSNYCTGERQIEYIV